MPTLLKSTPNEPESQRYIKLWNPLSDRLPKRLLEKLEKTVDMPGKTLQNKTYIAQQILV